MKPLTFERKKWVANDGPSQMWVNDVIWKILGTPKGELTPPTAAPLMKEAFKVCYYALIENGLHGLAVQLYQDRLKESLGPEFYAVAENDVRRTDIFLQELNWLVGPSSGTRVLAFGDFAMRKRYADLGQNEKNPRFIRELSLWTPTLAARDGVAETLLEAGYETSEKNDDRGYFFTKVTAGVRHSIRLFGTLWDASKNWSSDVERDIWDRAVDLDPGILLKLDCTDEFILALRRYAIDTLLGGAIELLDLVLIIEQSGDALDWERLRSIKNMFLKPDWFWAPLYAITILESKTCRRVHLPPWVREGIKNLSDSFWHGFIDSRLFWANPDRKLVEYSRAYVKLAKGT